MNGIEEKKEAMKEIRDAVWNFTGSPLYAYRKENKYYAVVGEGSHTAKLVFVGEAPGKNEAESGRPFCGVAGKILDEMLAGVSIKREEVYITNIVKDRPPNNRDPLPEEIAAYGPFLKKQIAIIEPKIIVPLGRFSMAYIMNEYGLGEAITPISKIHGKVFEVDFPHGKGCIIPFYHPAATIYNRATKEELAFDFKKLKKMLDDLS